MPKQKDIQHSILIVSASEKFNDIVKRPLRSFHRIDAAKSTAAARRMLLEQEYHIVAVNAPLPDESGEEFVLDIVEDSNTLVCIVVPQDSYRDVWENVSGQGVFVVSKPFPHGHLDKVLGFLIATRERIGKLEQQNRALQEKLEEARLVNRAKLLLMEKRNMTESEAHRYIGKQAMDRGASRMRIAQILLDEL